MPAQPSASGSAGPTDTIAAGSAPPSAASPTPSASTATTHFETSVDGLLLSADLDQAVVAPGGTLEVDALVRNERSTPITYTTQVCSPLELTVPLERPLDPPGKTWTGVAARFKDFILTQASNPGSSAIGASAPVDTIAPGSCFPIQPGGLLAPGGSLERRITWRAELTSGVPAVPGPVAFQLTFSNLTLGPNTSGSEVELDGGFEIAGPARSMLSVGQAIDAMLEDPVFAAWLPAQADWNWEANLMLQTGDGSAKYVPKGPAWDIELFPTPRNVDPKTDMAPYRRFARGYVDPFDGRILLMDICGNPCDR
jgi:hypothetical protein